ncbi:galactokinase family protein [Aerococcus urinaeequi]|uniref:galactokinase family protein n=1 Tax=Aerococcus urinaeequi TaxID=51665 RepID=UPI003EDB2EFD
MPNLKETFISEYNTSDDLRAVKSPLRICPIGAHSDYQNGRVTGMTIDALELIRLKHLFLKKIVMIFIR